MKQISIGFEDRQIEFLTEHPEVRISKLCRAALDDQIQAIDGRYLDEKEIN
jgi:hypothetical protein